MSHVSIASIIVTFCPDEGALHRLVKILESQVSKIFIIDNTPSSKGTVDVVSKHTTVEAIQLGKNLGVGAAQNLGIERADNEGFTHILLMDQDSVPACDMVEVLITYLKDLEQDGLHVAAVGPQLVDSRTEKERAFVRSQNGVLRSMHKSDKGWTQCDYLISAGCLIPMKTLTAVGGMEEDLFIDCVDFEWSYRAAAKGYCCVGVFETQLRQAFGETPLRLLGIALNMHSPVRHYYYFRNFCALLKRSYVSTAFKIQILLRSTLFMLILSTCSREKLSHLKMILRGIKHGLGNKLGPA